MNHLILSGHLGQEPDMSYTPNGVAVTKFSIAVKDYVGKNADGTAKIQTTWVNCVCFGRTAELVSQFVHKGNKLTVDGRLSIRKYEDKEKITRTAVECVVNSIDLPSRTKDSSEPVAEYGNYEEGVF